MITVELTHEEQALFTAALESHREKLNAVWAPLDEKRDPAAQPIWSEMLAVALLQRKLNAAVVAKAKANRKTHSVQSKGEKYYLCRQHVDRFLKTTFGSYRKVDLTRATSAAQTCQSSLANGCPCTRRATVMLI